MRTSRGAGRQKGTALLAVLWLSAVLSAIAFTVASTVRSEIERTSTDSEEIRAGFLASGAIERALLYIEWGRSYGNADGTARYFRISQPRLQFQFPNASATVDIIPETAKLSVNTSPPDELQRLLAALGVDAAQIGPIVAGIVDWRSASPGGAFTQLDQRYLSRGPSFQARHASLGEIEELLLIPGVTPDLFYGSFQRDAQGNLSPHAGLRDCLSVWASGGQLDANTVQPAVMQAVGLSADLAAAIVAYRNANIIWDAGQIARFVAGSPAAGRLGMAPSTFATLRATVRLRLPNGQTSDVRRSTAALVKFLGPQWNPPYHVMRWYDNAPSIQ